MIVQAFLRWVETAKAGERAKAANALGRAFLTSNMAADERRAARVAMTYLLDDPSPQVRLALADAIADSPAAPRGVVVSLAADQPEIACTVILRSPVLGDADLVDLAGRGNGCTRALIASRPQLSRGVAAALAEIGDVEEVLILLENRQASISRFSLKRIAERHGRDCDVRSLLLERDDLSADARDLLVHFVTEALSSFSLVQAAVGVRRIENIAREANAAATIFIAGSVRSDDVPALVEHLRQTGRLTPAFLMHALCAGRTDFFAAAIVTLSGLEERRVRAILATGRHHALRALLESAGLGRDISDLFCETVLLWRKATQTASGSEMESISGRLLERHRKSGTLSAAAGALLEMVEKLRMADERRMARDYASGFAVSAA